MMLSMVLLQLALDRNGDIFTQLDPYNVAVVGGRVLDVSIEGFLLGCGPQWLTSRTLDADRVLIGGLAYLKDLYGLGRDNVINF